MSTCTIEMAAKISSSMQEYFELEAPDKDNFVLAHFDNFISTEQNIPNFTTAEYIKLSSELDKTVSNLFTNRLLTEVSAILADTSVKKVIPKSNVVKEFSSNTIVDLFHALPLAKSYFEGSVNGKILKEILLGASTATTYVSTSAELTANLNNLKNNLFKEIQQFLIDKKLISNSEVFDLYDKQGNVISYDNYKHVMNTLSNYFFRGSFDMITSSTNKKIPNLTADFQLERDIYDAYNAGILLSNFDSMLNVAFAGLVDVNFNFFDNLTSNIGTNDKYTLKIEGIKTAYWKSDSHASESSENSEDKLTKLLISTIPAYDKKGNKTTGFMEMKDFYLFAAQLSNFEVLHGNNLRNHQTNGFDYFNNDSNKRLYWYITEIEKAIKGEKGSIQELSHFKDNYNFIISIKNFLTSPDFNIEVKEQNSVGSVVNMITQVINNNFGASYFKYDSSGNLVIQEMYKQDFNNIQVQNTTFSKLFNNSAKKDFFNLAVESNLTKFNSLFAELDGKSPIANISRENKIRINKYITAKTGIRLHYIAFDDLVKDLQTYSTSKVITVTEFKNLMKDMMTNLNTDFNNPVFVNDVSTQAITKASKGDSTVGKYLEKTVSNKFYIGIRNAYLMNFVIKPVMNVETLTGEKLPTFKTATLTYKDTELFELQRTFEKSNPTGKFKSLLIGDIAAITGTGTKLEAVNGDVNKTAVKFSVSENYISDFQFDFLKSLSNSKTDPKNRVFSIMIGNYSDKNTVLTKAINVNHKVENKVVITQSSQDILKIVRSQGRNYYFDTLFKVFSDYKLLFDTLGIKNNINVKTFESSFESNVKEINNLLIQHNVRNLLEQYTNTQGADFNKISLTEELHYSNYGENKIPALNQLLVDNYRIFSDTKENGLFFGKKGFVAQQEKNLIDKFRIFNKSLPSGIENLNFLDGVEEDEIKTYLKALNLTKEDFTIREGNKRRVDYTALTINGHLNPFLKKWQWINALYRNEYLFISAKGEYMHPHKNKSAIRDINSENFWEQYNKEASGRLSSMAKRNVMFTATIESPVRNSKLGVPDKINMAVIDDHKAELFNYSGDAKKNQDAHDGSSYIDYVYSLMIDASYPGKGYSGTKKQFGTLITPNGVTIKKDAESIITNDKILNSLHSKVSLLNKKKQMLSLPVGNITLKFEEDFDNEYFFNDKGQQYGIKRLELEGNSYKLYLSKKVGDGWVTMSEPRTGTFNTLFDLWSAFGGAYSTNNIGAFNEGSNELLYKVVTTADSQGNYPLKDKIIHIISNLSAVKAGGTNVNKADYWTNQHKLAYSSYESRFMGPQLDASHDADDSQIKEITQVISALAQNGNTAHLAREAYNDIANVIKKAAKPYLKYMEVGADVKVDELYKYLSDKFIKTIENTKGDNIAKTLVQAFEKDVRIPFSNQNFFVAFVKDVITRMNNEFITRYYSGTGAVLIPSHGIVQLYDLPQPDGTVKTVTQADMIKEALSTPSTGFNSNEEIIANHINTKLPHLEVDWDTIQMGDTILVPIMVKDILMHTDGVTPVEIEEEHYVPFTLGSPALYYQYKQYEGKVTKVYNQPRDLRPSQMSYKINGISQNIFDLDSIRLRFGLETGTLNDSDKNILQQFATKFNVDITDTDGLKFYLNKWTQRTLHLLDNKRVMVPLPRNEVIDFNAYFGEDNLKDSIYSDVKAHYVLKNSIPVTDYKFDAAELILGDIYQSKFNRTDVDSIYTIKNQGAQYFANQLSKAFEDDNTKADIKLNISTSDNPVYIRYVDALPGIDSSINLKVDAFANDEGITEYKYVRYNQKGDVMYTLPDINNIRVVNEDGKEVILIKAAVKLQVENNQEQWTRVKGFSQNLESLLKSFKGTIKSFIPLNNGDLSKPLDSSKFNRDTKKDEPDQLMLPNSTMYEFTRFSGYLRTDTDELNNNWFKNHKESIIGQLSNKMYASWEKSHEFVAARIPSQSMQSFMEMKNVAYFNTKSNDAYVSLWQIWLQGSDFDIDKAYILGSGFNSNGQFDLWTNVSNYTTPQQLHELEKFPIPTGIELADSLGVAQSLTEEFNDFVQSLNGKTISNELSAETLKSLNKALRKFNSFKVTLDKQILNTKGNAQTKQYKEIFIDAGEQNDLKKAFIDLINKHNYFTGYLRVENAVKNSVVSRIKEVISSPSNQLLANTPVDVDNWHKAANKAMAKSKKDPIWLSSYDMFSMYKQQRDAAVGKDDVGIAANGLKATFALTSYYNDYYENKLSIDNVDNVSPNLVTKVRQDLTTFKKEFTFVDSDGTSHLFNIATLSDVQINKAQQVALSQAVGNFLLLKSESAISLSGFTSAATDNAKELLMAKINATADLASMHIYMLALGFTPNQIAEIMTIDVVDDIIEKLEINIFFDNESPKINVILGKLATEYSEQGLEETDSKVINLKMIKDIYQGGQEMKLLSNLLGVNQRVSANVEEMNKFLTNFEQILYARENTVFGHQLYLIDKALTLELSTSIENKITNAGESWDKVLEAIFKYNKQLDPEKDKEFVKDIIRSANKVSVNFTDENGVRQTKVVSLVGGKFDFRYYIDKDNADYRKATKQYYNLVKNTINIFDVIDNVPHFKEMIDGLVLSHNMLINSSVKYNAVFSIIKDITREHSNKIVFSKKGDDIMNEHVSNQMGNSSLPVAIGKTEVAKLLLGIDTMLKDRWLKTEGSKSLTFDVKNLMELAGVKEIKLYTSDEARAEDPTDANASNMITVKLEDETSPIVTLDTNYGIANFKRITEELLLPILQSGKDNILTDSLKIESVYNPFGLRGNAITSTFPLSDLNNPVSIERFQRLTMAFNNLDINSDGTGKLLNAEKKNLKWRDVLYVYNLIVNNEKYGNKRLTPLFTDYMKEPNSLGFNFVTFSSRLDSGELSLFTYQDKLATNPDYINGTKEEQTNLAEIAKREMINDILFYTFNLKGQLYVRDIVNNQPKISLLKVTNPDFAVVTSITESIESKRRFKEFNELIRLIQTGGYIIKFKC